MTTDNKTYFNYDDSYESIIIIITYNNKDHFRWFLVYT